MTVSEVVKVLKDIKSISLSWNGTLHELDMGDPIMLDAFGDNLVAGIYSVDEGIVELDLAVRPMKTGEATISKFSAARTSARFPPPP